MIRKPGEIGAFTKSVLPLYPLLFRHIQNDMRKVFRSVLDKRETRSILQFQPIRKEQN